MIDREMIAVFHYDDGGSNRLGAEPYRYAEEIIRCKECKHYEGLAECKIIGECMGTNGFCSYGERSDNGKDIQSATE